MHARQDRTWSDGEKESWELQELLKTLTQAASEMGAVGSSLAKPEEQKGEKSGQWKLECPGQGLPCHSPQWAADLSAVSDIVRLELESRGDSSCALQMGLWKGKGPGECRFRAEF